MAKELKEMEGFEYYMRRGNTYYFRNKEEKFKKTPANLIEQEFYDAVRDRKYGIKYVFINY